MSPDGTRTKCSDAVDATGRYIWRENGAKNGRCCGIDFQQAAQKRRANKCSKTDPICASASMHPYADLGYDATIALAHGLDTLLRHKGIKPGDITADILFNATRQSTFEGASGKVAFLSNGDRRADHLEYSVYNYHATDRDFRRVGEMVGGAFVPCKGDCPPLIFSDGSIGIPDVRVGDTTFSCSLAQLVVRVALVFVCPFGSVLAIYFLSARVNQCGSYRMQLEYTVAFFC